MDDIAHHALSQLPSGRGPLTREIEQERALRHLSDDDEKAKHEQDQAEVVAGLGDDGELILIDEVYRESEEQALD